MPRNSWIDVMPRKTEQGEGGESRKEESRKRSREENKAATRIDRRVSPVATDAFFVAIRTTKAVACLLGLSIP